jgi:hypothetical protein
VRAGAVPQDGPLTNNRREGSRTVVGRLVGYGVLVSVLAGVLSGCVAIKEQEALQRAPGVVALRLKICVNDKDQTKYDQCIPPTNTAENDNGQDIILNPPLNGSAQLMVGFRVPDGTTAPASFQNSDGRLSFAASPGYVNALTAEYVPIAGFHWVGYLSTGVQLDGSNAANFLINISPEFGLNGVGGAPFTGPFRWRAVIGSRLINDSQPGSSPIDCPLGSQGCFDSPTLSSTTARVSLLHLATTLTVSDFSVRPPDATAVVPGEVATLTYKLTSQDARNFGAPTLTLKASTTLPGGQPQLGPTTIAIPRNGDTTALVSLPVPPGTPIGTYDVVLTATGNSLPAGADIPKSAIGKLTVVDKAAPAVRVSSPGDVTYTVGQSVTADYGCTDEAGGSGVSTCTGPVPSGSPIDTSSLGAKTFAVSGTDAAGNAATVTRTYTIVAPQPVVVRSANTGPGRVNVTFAFGFPSATKSTAFNLLQIKGVPPGSTVEAVCKGTGCPTQKVKGKRKNVVFTKKNASGTVSLKPFLKKSLRAGTVITVKVTKPGFFGMVKKLTVKANKRPTISTSCLQPNSKTSAACVSG